MDPRRSGATRRRGRRKYAGEGAKPERRRRTEAKRTSIPLPAPITQEATERWPFCVIRRGGIWTHEEVVRQGGEADESMPVRASSPSDDAGRKRSERQSHCPL